MNDAATILIIILSVVLTIFLVIAIVLVAYLIKLIKRIKTVADQVETTSVGIGETMANFAKLSSPVFVGKFIIDIIKKVKSK